MQLYRTGRQGFRFPARLCAGMFLILLLTAPLTARAQTTQAGNVSRVQGSAWGQRSGQDDCPAMELALGAPILAGDLLSTGPGARLEVDFLDGTRLTLGERSELRVDRYVYVPDEAAITLDMAAGVFRVVSGAIAEINPDKFSVNTPLAVIGIRGTDFWGGFLKDNELSVLLISGSGVTVTSQQGTVLIDDAGKGVTVDPQARCLPQARVWSDQRQAEAFATIAFE